MADRLTEWRSFCAQYHNELVTERDKLREIVAWIWREVVVQEGVHGLDLQDTMLKAGLIVEVPADEAFKELWGEDEDTMYVLAWQAKGATDE